MNFVDDREPDMTAAGNQPNVFYPAQCECGHLFLEKYALKEPNSKGEVGFCWCGFCRTKVMVKPSHLKEFGQDDKT